MSTAVSTPKRSKRYRAALEKIGDRTAADLSEAAAKVVAGASARFVETVEIHVRLGIDPDKTDQNVRGTVSLPHGIGKAVRIAVFAAGEAAEAARKAGADVVGTTDLAERIQGGELDFDVVIASPDQMKEVGKLGRILGPKGLMPNPKTGTVTADIARAVGEFKAGKVEFRNDKGGCLHAPIGKTDFAPNALAENAQVFLDAVVRAKPDAVKGVYLRGVALASTMGPSVRLSASAVRRLGGGA